MYCMNNVPQNCDHCRHIVYCYEQNLIQGFEKQEAISLYYGLLVKHNQENDCETAKQYIESCNYNLANKL